MLAISLMQIFSIVRQRYSGVQHLEAQIKYLKKQIEYRDFQAALLEYRLRDFSTSVAALIPQIDVTKQSSQTRSLASIITEPNTEAYHLERSSSLFENGRKYFRASDFEQAADIFRRITKHYPESIHVIEANFLLAECLYQLGFMEDSLDVIEKMIAQYPENDLTGFALCRMGQIMVSLDRIEDAIEVYETVASSFSNPILKKQAQNLLKEIQL